MTNSERQKLVQAEREKRPVAQRQVLALEGIQDALEGIRIQLVLLSTKIDSVAARSR